MKTVSTELFDLIKSLNKQEKRYFKLYSSRHVLGQGNKYVQLFDAIDKQEAFDEGKLKKKFAGEAFIKQLHVAKNYLYKLVLSSLRQYGEKKMEDDFVLQMRNARILYDKGLFDQSDKILRKIKKRATETEQFLQLLEIYRWERYTVHNHNDYKGLEEYVNVGFQNEMEILDLYRNFLEFQIVQDRIFIPYWKKGQIRNEEEKRSLAQLLEEEKLYSDEKNAKSFGARKFFHFARFTYYFLIGEHQKCYQHIKKLVEMFEEREADHGKGRQDSHYIRSIINLYAVQKQLHKYNEGLTTLQKLRSLPANSLARKAWLFVRSYNLEIDLYLSTGKFTEGIQNLTDFQDAFQRYIKVIDKQQRLGLYYNLAYLYFGAKDYDQALNWINALLNDPDLKTREDIQCFGRILNLFIHFELKNDQLLEYIVKSTYRFLSRRKRLFKVESVILRFLKKYPDWVNREAMIKGYSEIHEELQGLKNDEYENKAFDYFDFVTWLESKIEGKKFENIIQEKSKQGAEI